MSIQKANVCAVHTLGEHYRGINTRSETNLVREWFCEASRLGFPGTGPQCTTSDQQFAWICRYGPSPVGYIPVTKLLSRSKADNSYHRFVTCLTIVEPSRICNRSRSDPASQKWPDCATLSQYECVPATRSSYRWDVHTHEWGPEVPNPELYSSDRCLPQ